MNVDELLKAQRRIRRLLASGEEEIAAGRGFDLDEVLADADALFTGESKKDREARRS